MNARLTAAALRLAASGLHVFPCSRSKTPCTDRGFRDATRGPDAIGEAFARHGAALVGVATEASGLVVIDVDAKAEHDGRLWVFANAHRLPATRVHHTPSGGAHFVFAAPPGAGVASGNSRLARGVDVKARGGYVIWPGTEGDGYTVARDLPPVALPQWVVEACHPPPPKPASNLPMRAEASGSSRYVAAALKSARKRIESAAFGSQQSTLNAESYWIGRLCGAGELPEGEAVRELLAAGNAMPSQADREKWTAQQVEKIVTRAFRAGKERPRPRPATSAGGGRVHV